MFKVNFKNIKFIFSAVLDKKTDLLWVSLPKLKTVKNTVHTQLSCLKIFEGFALPTTWHTWGSIAYCFYIVVHAYVSGSNLHLTHAIVKQYHNSQCFPTLLGLCLCSSFYLYQHSSDGPPNGLITQLSTPNQMSPFLRNIPCPLSLGRMNSFPLCILTEYFTNSNHGTFSHFIWLIFYVSISYVLELFYHQCMVGQGLW